jgi:hypothetical protein
MLSIRLFCLTPNEKGNRVKRIRGMVLCVIGMMLAGCASTQYFGPAPVLTDADVPKARICVVRPFRIQGAAVRIPVYDDGHCVGRVGFDKPLCWDRPAGPSTISTYYSRRKRFSGRVAARGIVEQGSTYYFAARQDSYGDATLWPVEVAYGKRLVAKSGIAPPAHAGIHVNQPGISYTDPGQPRAPSHLIWQVLTLSSKKDNYRRISDMIYFDYHITGTWVPNHPDFAQWNSAEPSPADVERIRRSAESGLAVGQAVFGTLYMRGEGVQKDEKQAFRWFQKAATQGHADAQYFLGLSYMEGWGIEKDEKEAVMWFRKAAAQEHAAALRKLDELH